MRILIIMVFIHVFLSANSAASELDWEVSGFDMPESVVYDPIGKQLIVSNIDGHPMATNRQGYLSRVSLDGKIIEQKWITGMNAPKGMAIVGNTLFIADLKEIHRVDLEKQTLEESILIEDSIFLNDITSDSAGNVYISDFMDHKIYRLHNGKTTIWLEDELISHPNGLLVDEGTLYVGNWGVGMREDFTTDTLGSLIAVNLSNQQVTPVLHGEALGNLDGIIRIGNDLLVNDWINGKLFTLNPKGKKMIAQFPAGLADIGQHNNVIYLPLMLDDKLQAMRLTQ